MKTIVSRPNLDTVRGMMAQVMRSVRHFKASRVARMTITMTIGKNHLLSITR